MSTILKLVQGKYNTPQESSKKLVRDAVVEFVATTLFVFSGTMSAVSTGSTLTSAGAGDVARILPIAMCFGISILALAHSIGHLTGGTLDLSSSPVCHSQKRTTSSTGHMNPGVSLLMLFRGQMSPVKMLTYWVAQFLGALLASSLVWGCTSSLARTLEGVDRPPFTLGSTTLSSNLNPGNGFLIELMGSIVFYFVIAQTALDKRGIATTAFPAIPIGLVLVVVHVCLIPFTGCGGTIDETCNMYFPWI